MGALYYDLLERTVLEIQEERERAPKYFLTLWWGFDGLREGKDGVWIWVRRERKPLVPYQWAFLPDALASGGSGGVGGITHTQLFLSGVSQYSEEMRRRGEP